MLDFSLYLLNLAKTCNSQECKQKSESLEFSEYENKTDKNAQCKKCKQSQPKRCIKNENKISEMLKIFVKCKQINKIIYFLKLLTKLPKKLNSKNVNKLTKTFNF